MNTNKLKPFAQTARRILMEGVARRVLFLGFDAKGKVVEEPMPVAGGVILRGEVIDDPTLTGKWNALRSAIQRNGVENVVEEAAYTWFNRIMAIRILAKNNYDLSQLEYEAEGSLTPLILTRARRGTMSYLDKREQARVTPLLADYAQEQKAFAILLTGYCHHHRLLNKVFGRLNDYTELLLPDNALAETGFVHLLNTTDAISDDDYRKVELIGWLYQFYISERKDEVFASFKKNKKAEAEDIPAATQIFTPNWIVKYMVQNTIGRLWLDQHPGSPLKEKMKYLVESPQNENREEPALTGGLEEGFKLLDPACGSGHILVEGFYHLYDMYEEEYYMPGEAVEKILQHNLYGLDIDLRAAQLAQFAVLLAAASKHPDILKSEVAPHIYAMPEPDRFSQQDIREFLGGDGLQHEKVLTRALELMQQAKNLGSVMQFNVTDAERRFFRQRIDTLHSEARISLMAQSLYNKFLPFMQVMQLLTDRYEAIAANPPYMGQKNMNDDLKLYLNEHYPQSKSDLFAVFIEMMAGALKKKGRLGCITMESWMFLSSFENLRKSILENYTINSLSHFGWHILRIAFGTVAFILENKTPKSSDRGVYSYLTIDDTDREKDIPLDFPKKDNGRFAVIPQSNFSKIPGSPIAYWVSENGLNAFSKGFFLKDVVKPCSGQNTGDNNRFIRTWFEVSFSKIGFHYTVLKDTLKGIHKWFPYNKGGSFRKWYGNIINVVNWEYDGSEIKTYAVQRNNGKHWSRYIQNLEFMLKEGLTWSFISSSNFGVRFLPKGALFDYAGLSAFPIGSTKIDNILCILNSTVTPYFINCINPTFNLQPGTIGSIPYKQFPRDDFYGYGNYCIKISELDWDSQEISWNFKNNVLLEFNPKHRKSNELLDQFYKQWENKVASIFYQLHSIEEEINKICIFHYDLVDVLNPIISLKDITILQEELDFSIINETEAELRKRRQWRLEEGKWNLYVDNELQPIPVEGELPKATVQPPLPIKKNVVMQQLISYAVGCMMGRYSLDAPGLILANQGDSVDDYYRIVSERVASENKVTSDQWLVASEGKLDRKMQSYDSEELQGFDRVAESDGFGGAGVSGNEKVSEGGDVRTDQSAATGGSLGAIQYRGGSGASVYGGIPSVPGDSTRLPGRGGNPTDPGTPSQLSVSRNAEYDHAPASGNQQNDPLPHAKTPPLITHQLATSHYPLTTFPPDEDAIIPLMGSNCGFPDDAVHRIRHFIEVVWGSETLTQNINFLQSCLDMDLEKYLVTQGNFWKDHCSRYKKKPIYWLFSSKKGAFQVLTYMHRMNRFTVQKIRDNYLLRHLQWLNNQIAQLQGRASSLSRVEAKRLDYLRSAFAECEEYDLHLKNIADPQIEFDLDDGVSVNYEKFSPVVAPVK